MKLEGLDFLTAHQRLGGTINNNGLNNGHSKDQIDPLDTQPSTVEQLQWLARYLDDCHQSLLQSVNAQAYAHSRGINNDVIVRFKIGYSNSEVVKKLPKAGRSALTALGVLSKSGRDLFKEHLESQTKREKPRRTRRQTRSIRSKNKFCFNVIVLISVLLNK